jgi:ABC-type transport system involved in cytochrome bd biosynthesis fused ATPase/permease subunit
VPQHTVTHDDEPGGAGRILLAITRIWVPVAIAVVGIVAIVVGGGKDDIVGAAGVALVIVALIVWMVNWMYRMSVQSNQDREREEEAREYFDRHGRWPDE